MRHIQIQVLWSNLIETSRFSNVRKSFKVFNHPYPSFESFLSEKQVAPSYTSLASLGLTTLILFHTSMWRNMVHFQDWLFVKKDNGSKNSSHWICSEKFLQLKARQMRTARLCKWCTTQCGFHCGNIHLWVFFFCNSKWNDIFLWFQLDISFWKCQVLYFVCDEI